MPPSVSIRRVLVVQLLLAHVCLYVLALAVVRGVRGDLPIQADVAAAALAHAQCACFIAWVLLACTRGVILLNFAVLLPLLLIELQLGYDSFTRVFSAFTLLLTMLLVASTAAVARFHRGFAIVAPDGPPRAEPRRPFQVRTAHVLIFTAVCAVMFNVAPREGPPGLLAIVFSSAFVAGAMGVGVAWVVLARRFRGRVAITTLFIAAVGFSANRFVGMYSTENYFIWLGTLFGVSLLTFGTLRVAGYRLVQLAPPVYLTDSEALRELPPEPEFDLPGAARVT